ncbi:MAG: thioredoxin-disulfide reductase [Candidatus Woesearchaeota archaeon]
MEKVVIIGGGISGYTAAIYAARANLEPLVITGPQEGGQIVLASAMENFPGFPDGISGTELSLKVKKQAEKFGTRFLSESVKEFNIISGHLEIITDNKKIETAAVIIATGASARWLGLDSERKYRGRGVHSCATCDGFFYKEKELIVVGGGDTACEESLFLTKFAKKVTIIHRRDELRASKIMRERVKNHKKIVIIWDSVVEDITGDDKKVTGIKIKNVKTGKIKYMKIDGVFVAIGHTPNTEIFRGKIDLDENGFVKTDENRKTNVAGVFSCGDVQDTVYKQAITAAGSAAEAAIQAEKYCEGFE